MASKVRRISPTEIKHSTQIETPEVEEVVQEPITEVVEPVMEVKEELPTQTVTLPNAKSDVIISTKQSMKVNKVDSSVTFIKEYISNYVDYIKSAKIKRVDESIAKFKNIMMYVLSHPDDNVLNEVYALFKVHHSSILAPEIALQGIQYLSSSQQEKIQQIYTLFYHITSKNKKNSKLDLVYASSILGNSNIISYVSKKL